MVDAEVEGWTCSRCGREVTETDVKCSHCGEDLAEEVEAEPAPSGIPPAAPTPEKGQDVEYSCTGCGNRVAESDTRCHFCGEDLTEVVVERVADPAPVATTKSHPAEPLLVLGLGVLGGLLGLAVWKNHPVFDAFGDGGSGIHFFTFAGTGAAIGLLLVWLRRT